MEQHLRRKQQQMLNANKCTWLAIINIIIFLYLLFFNFIISYFC